VDYTELLTTARKWFLSFFVEQLAFTSSYIFTIFIDSSWPEFVEQEVQLDCNVESSWCLGCQIVWYCLNYDMSVYLFVVTYRIGVEEPSVRPVTQQVAV